MTDPVIWGARDCLAKRDLGKQNQKKTSNKNTPVTAQNELSLPRFFPSFQPPFDL